MVFRKKKSSADFNTNSIKEVQLFLKTQGVFFSDQRKIDVVELCESLIKHNTEVDPDGL